MAKSLKILDLIHEYRNIVSNNIQLSSQFNGLVKFLFSIFRFILLSKEKELLLKNLEISRQYKKLSEVFASKDLLKKLNESIELNKKKLEFLEEDYLHQKEQINLLEKTLNTLNLEIQELNKQKKFCFSQINKITREMSGDSQELEKSKEIASIKPERTLSNAEKIKSLQTKAKEIQFEISKIKSKISKTQIKLEEITPTYESYKIDYESLLEIINLDEKKIIELQSELKSGINEDNKNTFLQNLDVIDLKLLQPPEVLEEEIRKIDSELINITIPKDIYNPLIPHDLSLIIKKLIEFDERVKNCVKEITIDTKQIDIMKYFEQFKKLETNLTEINYLVNKFLPKINLKSQFRIIVNNDVKNFFIEIKFLRNDKEQVDFNNLTTPEKIFFVIVFYISIKLHIRDESIIFSNISLLNKYNKAGSIFRTIRKILPIFKKDDSLSKFNLIFIIANLELKNEIKDLKIKIIKES
ncbi:MAG: hypothetical protein ACFE9I_06315 [Candidatus Hermodarchaeota archaeon]